MKKAFAVRQRLYNNLYFVYTYCLCFLSASLQQQQVFDFLFTIQTYRFYLLVAIAKVDFFEKLTLPN